MTDSDALVAEPARIRWWVYTGERDADGRAVRIPRTATMRGRWPGYDAECSCGWESATGGAIRAYIERQVWMHKRLDHVLPTE